MGVERIPEFSGVSPVGGMRRSDTPVCRVGDDLCSCSLLAGAAVGGIGAGAGAAFSLKAFSAAETAVCHALASSPDLHFSTSFDKLFPALFPPSLLPALKLSSKHPASPSDTELSSDRLI